MVREAFSVAVVLAAMGVAQDFPGPPKRETREGGSPARGVAEALVLGREMAPVERTLGLPADAQKRLIEYRQREVNFKSGLKPSPGASEGERELYERRVGIERVIFSLFPRGDSGRVASGYALDADFERGARFIDELLRDLQVRWLAPYLNLVAGHDKLCAGQPADARRQLVMAREGGHPLIRIAAQELIETGRCFER